MNWTTRFNKFLKKQTLKEDLLKGYPVRIQSVRGHGEPDERNISTLFCASMMMNSRIMNTGTRQMKRKKYSVKNLWKGWRRRRNFMRRWFEGGRCFFALPCVLKAGIDHISLGGEWSAFSRCETMNGRWCLLRQSKNGQIRTRQCCF